MQFPIVVGLRRSIWLLALIGALGLTGVSAVLCVGWPLPIRLGLAFALTLMAVHGARSINPSLHSLRIDADGKIGVHVVRGETPFPVRLGPGSVVHPWLSVLRLAGAGRTWVVVLTPDSTAKEEFRRLRACLRRPDGFSAAPGDS